MQRERPDFLCTASVLHCWYFVSDGRPCHRRDVIATIFAARLLGVGAHAVAQWVLDQLQKVDEWMEDLVKAGS